MRYYLDTSIWLDLFEGRDEPNLPKGKWAEKLIVHILRTDEEIVLSEVVLSELENIGYPATALHELLSWQPPILLVEGTEREHRRSKELARRRGIPKADVEHALIARAHNAVLVSLDRHFTEVKDLVTVKKPNEIV